MIASSVQTPPAPPADAAIIAEGIRLLIDDGCVFEVRGTDIPRGEYNQPVSGYFTDPSQAAGKAAAIEGGAGVYLTLNQLDTAFCARDTFGIISWARKDAATKDKHVTRRRWLLLDIDSNRVTGVCATDAELAHAAELTDRVEATLTDQYGFPDPITITSGNGFYLLYRVDLPNDDEMAKLFQNFLNWAHDEFRHDGAHVDDSVYNAARIVRIPGTINTKGRHTAERPHRMCRVLHVPDVLECVSAETIRAAIGSAPAASTASQTSNDDTFDMLAYLQQQNVEVLREEPHNGGTKYIVVCPYCGCNAGKASVFVSGDGTPGFHCFHASCVGSTSFPSLRDKLEGTAWRQQSVDVAKRYQEYKQQSSTSTLTPPAPPAPPKDELRWEPMPLDGFPQIVQEYILAKSKSLSVDPSLVAMSVLAACSGAIGYTHGLRVKSDYLVSAGIWAQGIVNSGVGKTAIVNSATAANQQHDMELAVEYRREKKVYDAQRKGRKNNEESEGLTVPICKQVALQNFTIEALKLALSQNPRGLLALSAEGATVLRSFGEYKQGRGESDRAYMCQVWSHEWSKTNRKKDNEILVAAHPYVAMLLMCQDESFRNAMPPDAYYTGFAYRFLLAFPPELSIDPLAEGVSEVLQSKYDRIIYALYGLSPDFSHNSRPIEVLVEDHETRMVWASYVLENEGRKKREEVPRRIKESFAKYQEYSLRLALWHHIVHAACRGADRSGEWSPDGAFADRHIEVPKVISRESMEWGVGMAKWFQNEGERVYSWIGYTEGALESGSDGLLDKVVEYLKEKGPMKTYDVKSRFRRDFRSTADFTEFCEAHEETFKLDGKVVSLR